MCVRFKSLSVIFKDVEEDECLSVIQRVYQVATKMEGPTIFLKWKVDVIAVAAAAAAGEGTQTTETAGAENDKCCCVLIPLFEGSTRRCG